MAWRIEIDGIDRTEEIGHAELRQILNERGSATLGGDPELALPARFAEFVVYGNNGVAPFFGGILFTRDLAGLVPGSAANAPTFDLQDWGIYASWCVVTLTYTAPVALEDVVADIITQKLGAYGITYTPVATGIMLGPFSWLRKNAAEALRELSDRSGRVFQFHPDKSLTLDVPGASAAPFAITDADRHCHDLTWRDSERTPANTVIMICGTGQAAQSEDFTAPTVSGGGVDYYKTSLPASLSIDNLWPNVLIVNGVAIGPVSWGDDIAFAWYWHPGNHDLVHIPARGGYMPVPGDVITVGYTAQYPFEVIRTTGAVPPIELVVERPEVYTRAQAEEIGDGLLAGLAQGDPRELAIVTDEDGCAPGQALTIALTTLRGTVVGVFLITAVHVTLQNLEAALYELTATPIYQGSYLGDWRALTSGSGGASSGGGGGGVVSIATTALSSPVYMGGARSASVPNPSVKALIPNAVPYVAAANFTGRLHVALRARDAGVGVKAIISDGIVDVATSVVTSQAFVDEFVVVAIVAGRTYFCYIQTTTPGDGYCAFAQLKAA